jgi:hypothetical protein
MQEILFEYEMHPTTWVYLSSLLIIGIYFKFNRVWSVRNLDLVGLIFFAPGLLLVTHDLEQWGYVWLFTVSGLFLLRLLLDPLMVRRPLLEPNLSASGLTFTGIALLVFLLTNVVTAKVTDIDMEGAVRWDQILARRPTRAEDTDLARYGPGYPLFYAFADLANRALVPEDEAQPEGVRQELLREATTRTTAILGHIAVVVGIALIGYRHFGNVHTGVAAASLYLLLPYTSQFTGRVDHVVPAALLVWAVAAYRRPLVAGILVGLATGVIYYPIFLLPLWCSFYWRRGIVRFSIGVVTVLLLLTASLAFTSADLAQFGAQLKQMVGWTSLSAKSAHGFWEFYAPAYRIPVLAAFLALAGSMALWPAQKHLGALLSCSAAVMLATQFWHTHQGGIYMAWYLPLLVLTVFRPNLEDRVALTAVDDSWLRGLQRFWLRLQHWTRRKRSAAPRPVPTK